MIRKKHLKTKWRKTTGALICTVLAVTALISPITAYASNPQYAPQYQFETTFTYNQWGRPTTSNVAPQHTQNIRRDRHSAYLPPSHGIVTGFFSGEFPTNPANPFAPRYNNNPHAGRILAIEESPFALLPGEHGVNVRAEGNQEGGFLINTSVTHSGSGNNSQGSNDVTVTHRPTAETSHAGMTMRMTVVEPWSDGTIGRITIPALGNRTVSVRPGLDMSTLNNYVGHFPNTSQWDGNIAFASHNRGRGSFFAGIWTLQGGDRIIYETTMGTRVYEVVSIEQIAETDLTNLNHSHENTLTLVTCVYNRPALRWSVRAREVI